MGFEGFADDGAKFWKALAKHNERSWFLAHKTEYEEGWNAPMKALLADVAKGIDRAFPRCDLGEPRVFRVFRDVRFAKDKSPYKTHAAGFIPVARTGKKTTDVPFALYFHIGATERFGAAGHYIMDTDSLSRFRLAVEDDARGMELEKILAKLAKRGYVADAHEGFKRVPKGFDPEHPRAELLKRKGLTVRFPDVPKGILTSPRLVKWLIDATKMSAPLVEWLVYATA